MSAPSTDLWVHTLTPAGAAGVAVLEVRGAETSAALQRLGVAERPAGTLHLVALRGPDGPLDEALCWRRGSQHAELHLHGSAPLLARVRAALGAGSTASHGEPNGRGLAEAWIERAWQVMAQAPSEVGARLALAQAEGALVRALAALPAEDWRAAQQILRTILAESRRAQVWLRPTTVVLQGPVNAGKSTLFNALLGYQRVITSEEQGTTRDAIRERILLGGWPVDLVDTAGWREVGADSLEGRGQSLGQAVARSADWVVFLAPPGYDGPVPDGATRFDTQGDRPGAAQGALEVLRDPHGAVERVLQALRARLGAGDEPPWGRPLALDAEQIAGLAACAAAQDEASWQRAQRALPQELP